VNRAIVAILFVLSGSAWGQFNCPAPPSPSEVACTYGSISGTTTYTATVTAGASGSAAANTSLSLYVLLDGSACNLDNYGIPMPVLSSPGSVNVEGKCTFDVTSDKTVRLTAFSATNGTPNFISVATTIDAFVPDAFLTVSRVGSGTVTTADNRINCGLDCTESYAANSLVTLTATAAFGYVFSGWSGDCTGTARTCVVTMSAARNVTANFQFANFPLVVEFHNTALDHYFITADSVEALAVDAGAAGPGWTRTGLSFKPGGATQVCRFYGSPLIGPNSHFYTAFPLECFGLQLLASQTPSSQPKWNFEGIAFSTTEPTLGTCPAGTLPVYRAYNDGLARGIDSNHRITTSVTAINDVVARGWKAEGVVMCVPQ
jgi:uncharacterized repeat protein (TIGR02543 family)